MPLYQEIKEFYGQEENRNQGLYFEKFIDTWDFQGSPKIDKKIFLENFLGHNSTDGLLSNYLERRHRLARKLNGKIFESKNLWRLVSGLGSAHPTEAGFVWHRTLGVPYLPGSSLKGALRAWLTHWEQGEANRINELFGDAENSGQGRLIVFDALPVAPPTLELDVMNPHYAPYYGKMDDPNVLQTSPPADYYAPIPVFFLTVAAGQSFEFVLAPTPGLGTPEDLEAGVDLLKEALTTTGVGAKTAVGYGVFEEFREKTKSIFDPIDAAEKAEERERLEKLSPFERYCFLLESGLQGDLESHKKELKENSIKLYQELANLNDSEKLKAALLLRDVWRVTGDWEGKMSEKQALKVKSVEKLLRKANDV